jgi:hypothetical protein
MPLKGTAERPPLDRLLLELAVGGACARAPVNSMIQRFASTANLNIALHSLHGCQSGGRMPGLGPISRSTQR